MDIFILGSLNFGDNLKNWAVDQLGALFLVVWIVGILYLAATKKTSGLLGWFLVGALIVPFVFNPDLIKSIGEKLYSLIFV